MIRFRIQLGIQLGIQLEIQLEIPTRGLVYLARNCNKQIIYLSIYHQYTIIIIIITPGLSSSSSKLLLKLIKLIRSFDHELTLYY